ncbi:TetR-like C-terminal domain-containing protein [Paenibacillus phocaensis]|uniref:TetR-like C-terminal domain-containing protein n=1 Tax=Paenibacillus phocaensis TaxID=1776378 RepID=UPI000B12FE71|nr:TetR-like C-terminal domain-containing protein [Paenibacillus phocaensis]
MRIMLKQVISLSSSHLTKKALAASLKQRMAYAPLNKITVKHLVDDCGLNRQTFYYHFQDIYELLGWIYQTEAVDAIAGERGYRNWTSGFLKIFKYIEDNRAFCLNTLNSLARSHLDSYLYTVTNQLVMGVVEEVSSGMQVDEADQRFLANFYTLAFTGLVVRWMQDGMKERPEQIIDQLSELADGHFERALQRYEQKASRPPTSR